MPFVLDGSIVMSWALDEEVDAVASAALARLSDEDEQAHAPTLWWMEIRNALIVNERRKRITPVKTARLLGALSRFNVMLDSQTQEAPLLSLARQHGLTVYDAAYLELTLRLGLPLATLDKALAKAARSEGLQLVG